MRWFNLSIVSCVVCSVTLVVGCARPDVAGGVDHVTCSSGVADARYQRVREYPSLRVDSSTSDKLQHAQEATDLAVAQAQAEEFLAEAHHNALRAARNELDRLDDAGWSDLARKHSGIKGVPDEWQRQVIWTRFVEQTDAQYVQLQTSIAQAHSVQEIRAILEPIEIQIQPSIKTRDRVARALPWILFTVPSIAIVRDIHAHEYRGPQEQTFTGAVCYTPAQVDTPATDIADTEPWDLLWRHAPMILQEMPKDPPSYDPAADRFGRVVADSRDALRVATDDPVVYACSRTIDVQGVPRVQLIYTYWYPEHPKLKKRFDAERGKFEGITLRITLGRDFQPAIYETVYNCGCYHRLYPTEDLDKMCWTEFGSAEKGKVFAIEHNARLKIDMIVPKVIKPTEATSARALLRTKAGWHGVVDVSSASEVPGAETAHTRTYTLVSYDELERVPIPGGGYTSLFQSNGLVRGAQRAEGMFFTPIGMLSAGQPRQRGTQLIHWDHWDFDDPDLFEQTLRLPSGF